MVSISDILLETMEKNSALSKLKSLVCSLFTWKHHKKLRALCVLQSTR
jgi:hypothetical protein